MPEILVISGKGGTGKTSITAAFAHLSRGAVICDLDVDAPDLHLILRPELSPERPFVAGLEACIDAGACTACGLCVEMCRYGALRLDGAAAVVDLIRCEGCAVCARFCPAGAIAMAPKTCGYSRISETRFGRLVHAQLYPGEENSGKLVALLRQEAKALAKDQAAPLILADGPPGIGCPVISALSGTDLAVIVTEPTPSGVHDLRRVVELCGHFRVPAAVIINKSDLNPEQARQIHTDCQAFGLSVVAELPHDPAMVHAMVRGAAITELEESPMSRRLRACWEQILSSASNPQDTAVSK